VCPPPNDVRVRFNELRPFQTLKPPERGWTLSVYKLLQEMNKRSFRLSELYQKENSLEKFYPKNRNIRAKIRQRLQILRYLGFVKFLGEGRYEILSADPSLRSGDDNLGDCAESRDSSRPRGRSE